MVRVAASAVLAENAIASEIQGEAVAMVTEESVVTPIPNPTIRGDDDTSILAAAVAKESPIGVGGPQPTQDSAAVSVAVETVLPTATLSATDTPLPPTATATVEFTPIEPTCARKRVWSRR